MQVRKFCRSDAVVFLQSIAVISCSTPTTCKFCRSGCCGVFVKYSLNTMQHTYYTKIYFGTSQHSHLQCKILVVLDLKRIAY